MVEPVSECQTDRKGKRGVSSHKATSFASTHTTSAKAAHSTAPLITNQLFSNHPFTIAAQHSLHFTASKYRVKECSKCTVQKEGVRLGNFVFLLDRSLCLLLSRLLRSTLKLGSGGKHPHYALNKLSMGLLFQSCLHYKHFLAIGPFSWLGLFVAAGAHSLGGHVGFQAGLCLIWPDCCVDLY